MIENLIKYGLIKEVNFKIFLLKKKKIFMQEFLKIKILLLKDTCQIGPKKFLLLVELKIQLKTL